VVGLNQNTIGDGIVANIQIAVSAAAIPGSYPLTLSIASATDPSGAVLPLAVISGSLAVQRSSQVITFNTPPDVPLGSGPVTMVASASSALPVTFSTTTLSVCSVSGVAVAPVSTGACVITADQAGNASFLPAASVTRSFQITPAPQTITFAPLSDVVVGSGPVALSASASSGLPVSFTSTTQAVCTVAATSVTLASAGACFITASQAGNANYAAASPVIRSFSVLAIQTLDFTSPGDLPLGTLPFALAGFSTSGLAVTYNSTTPGICSVSNGTVSLLATGTCSITANQSGGSGFGPAAPASISLQVLPAIACAYSLAPATGAIAQAGGAGNLRVVTVPGCSWSAQVNDAFLSLTSDTSGTGPATISYSVAANDTGAHRSGTISVTGVGPGVFTFTLNQFAADCSFLLSDLSLNLSAAGGSALVSVYASGNNCSWASSVSDAAGVTLSPANGAASTQTTVSVTANSAAIDRPLSATIGGQQLTIRQSGAACNVLFSAAGRVITAEGGPGSVNITVPAGCSYSAVTGSSWINVTSGKTGIGPGTVFFSVDANPTTDIRFGAITIGGKTFGVTQRALSCAISIDTSGLGSPFPAAATTGAIGVGAADSACPWSAASNAAWLTVVAPGRGSGSGSFSVSAAPNTSVNSRSAQITVAGQSVTLAQSGVTCAFTLRSPSGTAPASGGVGSAGVISAPGCAWTSNPNAPWLTITSSANTGAGDVQFSAAANNGASSRSGTLTIAGQTYTINQPGAPCNYNLAVGSVVIPAAALNNSTVTFTTAANGCTPKAVSYSNWLPVSAAFGGNAGAITYSAAANSLGTARVGIVKLGDQALTVTQNGTSCSYTLSSNSAVFRSSGGPGSVTITASAAGCTPAVAGGAGFVTPGALSGPVANVFIQSYTVAPFTSLSSAPRSSRLTIGGRSYVVKQTAW
jgi:hypothetical protein